MIRLVQFLPIFFILYQPSTSVQPYPASCSFSLDRVRCHNVGPDGRPVDILLREMDEVYNGRNVGFQELAPIIKELVVLADQTNVTVKISENGLAQLSNLEYLHFIFEPGTRITREQFWNFESDLYIGENEFRNTPHLKTLKFQFVHLQNTTIRAIEQLKDRLEVLWLDRASLDDRKPIELAAKFTNLRELIVSCNDTDVFPPPALLQGLATKLTSLDVRICNMATVTPEMFRGMRNLVKLYLYKTNVTTIEPGSFDELVNLEEFTFLNNPIKVMPDGLFNKTKKLKIVYLQSTNIENLSSENFTSHVNFISYREQN